MPEIGARVRTEDGDGTVIGYLTDRGGEERVMVKMDRDYTDGDGWSYYPDELEVLVPA